MWVMSVTPENSERRLASQGNKELTLQETQVEPVGFAARCLEGFLDSARLGPGQKVTLEALFLERDCPDGVVSYSDYNERTKKMVGQEYIYPVVSIAGDEGWFVLGGINFSEPKEVQAADFYFDMASWWSDGQRVFMRDADTDILPSGIKRFTQGATIAEKILATTELSGLFKKK